MNTATPRIDRCDQENGRRRHLAIERGEVKFTADPNVVDYGEEIFPGNGSLVKFLKSGEAAVAYIREFFYPFVQSRSAEECSEALLNPPPEVVESTLRLMGRFQGGNADEDDAACVDGGASEVASSDAKKYHSFFTGRKVTKWASMLEKRIPGCSPPEERQRKNPKASRYTNLCRAAAAAPWLWFLKPDGSLRMLDIDVGKYDRALADFTHVAVLRAQTLFSLRHADLL